MMRFKKLPLIMSKRKTKKAIKRIFFFNGALIEDEMCGVGVMHSSTWPTPGRGQAFNIQYPYTPLCKGPALGTKNIHRYTLRGFRRKGWLA